MPAKTFFDWPSPKANINPPTTIATRLSPVAIGPVKAVLRTFTAFVPRIALLRVGGRGQEECGGRATDGMAQYEWKKSWFGIDESCSLGVLSFMFVRCFQGARLISSGRD